jgi:hypothetical protein
VVPPPPPGPPPPQTPRGHAAMPGWSPGTRGLELCLCGRQTCRRSLVGLPRSRLHRRPWRIGRGHRRRSSTFSAMTTTTTARLRPCRRLRNPSLG